MTWTVDPRVQCDGKVRHLSRRAARAARKHYPGGPGHLTVYLCPHCKLFHLGNAWVDDALDPGGRMRARQRQLPVESLDSAAAHAVARVMGCTVAEALELVVDGVVRDG